MSKCRQLQTVVENTLVIFYIYHDTGHTGSQDLRFWKLFLKFNIIMWAFNTRLLVLALFVLFEVGKKIFVGTRSHDAQLSGSGL